MVRVIYKCGWHHNDTKNKPSAQHSANNAQFAHAEAHARRALATRLPHENKGILSCSVLRTEFNKWIGSLCLAHFGTVLNVEFTLQLLQEIEGQFSGIRVFAQCDVAHIIHDNVRKVVSTGFDAQPGFWFTGKRLQQFFCLCSERETWTSLWCSLHSPVLFDFRKLFGWVHRLAKNETVLHSRNDYKYCHGWYWKVQKLQRQRSACVANAWMSKSFSELFFSPRIVFLSHDSKLQHWQENALLTVAIFKILEIKHDCKAITYFVTA